MIRLGPWLLAALLGTAMLMLAWWGWQRMGMAALQLGMGNC